MATHARLLDRRRFELLFSGGAAESALAALAAYRNPDGGYGSGLFEEVGRHDKTVRDHDWLATATEYSLRRIRELDGPGHALEFRFALQLLDAVHDLVPGAGAELRRLGGFLPVSGSMAVAGGIADEAMRPVDFVPEPDRPIRALFPGATIEADLDRLSAEQRDDGGWTVDWGSFSAASALEWRGWATVDLEIPAGDMLFPLMANATTSAPLDMACYRIAVHSHRSPRLRLRRDTVHCHLLPRAGSE
jgi:hypothetical protein